MLTTDTDLEILLGLATSFDPELNELSNTCLIECGKWVVVYDLGILIGRQERAGVIPAQTQTGLGQVVGSEAEKLGVLSHFSGGQSSTWNLNHRSHRVGQLIRAEKG